MPRVYDFLQTPTIQVKKSAVNNLDLKQGDHVIVFCCGTGQEFPFIEERIGPEGEILGVDWSHGMLEQARRKIADDGWMNVNLLEGDVSALPDDAVRTASYDAGICILGMAVISEPEKAFKALKNAVKGGGRIVIGDICSFSGVKSILNPLVTLTNLAWGNTRQSLAHSRVFAEALPSVLLDAKLEWHVGGSYYIASGRRPDALLID
jgi:demethylmenaquinone methyltransferase/2-methoxy-6-polyprenyl-1,4-benzoquinol methylase